MKAAADAQVELDAAGTLDKALIEMSNKNIDVDENGLVDDDDVVTWAESVLGVGEQNVGKIDEMSAVLEAAAAEEAPETPDTETPETETIDPVVPVDPVP